MRWFARKKQNSRQNAAGDHKTPESYGKAFKAWRNLVTPPTAKAGSFSSLLGFTALRPVQRFREGLRLSHHSEASPHPMSLFKAWAKACHISQHGFRLYCNTLKRFPNNLSFPPIHPRAKTLGFLGANFIKDAAVPKRVPAVAPSNRVNFRALTA